MGENLVEENDDRRRTSSMGRLIGEDGIREDWYGRLDSYCPVPVKPRQLKLALFPFSPREHFLYQIAKSIHYFSNHYLTGPCFASLHRKDNLSISAILSKKPLVPCKEMSLVEYFTYPSQMDLSSQPCSDP
ncbi:hypothetical protein ACH5RR_017989 [Cinchona calisaya]|uniref:Maturase K n=1 Tax=Cinchona calisaya TaxID=153742 RepID=A0ABD2ZNT0_9GENT